jgi:hypothetical protein
MAPTSALEPPRTAPEKPADAPEPAAGGGRINAEQWPQEVLNQRLVGKQRRIYEAGLRSGWDSYHGAIAAAREGDVRRLVDCLRGRKPLTDGDRKSLADYIATKVRRRRWPPELERALGESPTEDDYDVLADIVERTGRGRGGVSDEPAHRAARIARVILSLWRGPVPDKVRESVVERTCKREGDQSGVVIDPELVHNILDHPTARDWTR